MATLTVTGLSKRFGPVTAVSGLEFTATPGRVTGFLGPNGAGKSTTLRMVLGLIRPDSGTATIDGVRYRELPHPTRAVGAALDLAGAHPALTGRRHLQVMAALGGHPSARIDRVLAETGLQSAADRRVGGWSTGMRQRLALATALLGEPEVLILDEPSNGLDPAGIRWLRDLLRRRAADGHTVLLSSHQLGEIERAVDDVVIINLGVRAWHGPVDELLGSHASLEEAFLAHTAPTATADTPDLEDVA